MTIRKDTVKIKEIKGARNWTNKTNAKRKSTKIVKVQEPFFMSTTMDGNNNEKKY